MKKIATLLFVACGPSDEDKAFSAKLCNNELISSLRDNPALIKIFEEKGFTTYLLLWQTKRSNK